MKNLIRAFLAAAIHLIQRPPEPFRSEAAVGVEDYRGFLK